MFGVQFTITNCETDLANSPMQSMGRELPDQTNMVRSEKVSFDETVSGGQTREC